jgi:hypothetical protein
MLRLVSDENVHGGIVTGLCKAGMGASRVRLSPNGITPDGRQTALEVL